MSNNPLTKSMVPQFNPYYLNYYHPYQYYPPGYPNYAFNSCYQHQFCCQHASHQMQNYPSYSQPNTFTTQFQNIPIQNSIHLKKVNADKKEKIIKKPAHPMKSNEQKENRNVYSNLLRLFFKNMLEVELYDKLIGRIIQNFKLTLKVEEFIEWLIHLRVNFKNYVKLNTVKNILEKRGTKEHKLILRIILKEYLNKYCLNHSLTSKRIDQRSAKMHLEGVRELYHQLLPQMTKKD